MCIRDRGSSKKEGLAATTDLFDALDTKPLKVGSRRLTQSLAVTGVAALLYGGKDAWPGLEKVIAAGISGQGAWLLQMADALNSRDENGNYDTMFYAFPAISCLDTGDERGVLDADELWVEDAKKAPIFGHYFGPQYSCPLWPVRPARQLQIRGVGAAPLLVIGGTGDNATPYQQAVSMACLLYTSGRGQAARIRRTRDRSARHRQLASCRAGVGVGGERADPDGAFGPGSSGGGAGG